MLTVYGAQASGSVAVEAALTLLGIPYDLVEAVTWAEEAARDRVAPVNPMRQVPTLVLEDGTVMTESAAILLWLADRHPESGLAPSPMAPERAQFLRWMLYVSSSIYALHWLKPDPARLGVEPENHARTVRHVHDRIAAAWAAMDAQIAPGHYIIGDTLTVLDLYVTVVSRFGPWRRRFYAMAPRLAETVRRVDAEPRLAAFWAARFPFEPGWEQ